MKKLVRAECFPLLLLIAANLLIGWLVLPAYGESWDEAGILGYAGRSLRAYPALLNPELMPVSLVRGDPLFGDHGPAFVMTVVLIERLVSGLGLPVLQVQVDHFVYFLAFQTGVVAFYFLARRWLSPPAAFGATALFSTQPLLWGHAFINPKDTPFLAFFCLSLALGLWMVDRSKTAPGRTIETPLSLRQELAAASATHKKRWGWIAAVWFIFFAAIWLFGTTAVQRLVTQAYNDGTASFLGRLFQQVAPQAQTIPVSEYLRKALTLFNWLRLGLALFSLGLLTWMFAALTPISFRSALAWLKKTFFATLAACLTPDVLLAGLSLGFTAAIRIVAPLAGVIVVGCAVLRKKAQIPRLLAYTLVSVLVMIALWPHLWPDLWGRLLYSLTNSSTYPLEMKTLFAGQLYIANQIPRAYLPVLLALQITEPTLLLSILGFGLALIGLFQKKLPPEYPFLLGVWFFLPFSGFVISNTPLFDNFRHVLFILPPLFLLAGTALEWFFARLTAPALRFGLLAVAVLPALVANVCLHPYQYLYYNQLTGGVTGAFRQYQLDYWCLSYREAALYLNHIAPPNARIVPVGPYHLLRFYARPDLQFIDPYTVTDWRDYDYLVLSTRDNQDLNFAQFPTVFSVERAGVPLTVVKKP